MKLFSKYCIFIFLVSHDFVAEAQMDSLALRRIYFNNFSFTAITEELWPSVTDSITTNTRFYDILQSKTIYSPQTGNSGAASLDIFGEMTLSKTMKDGFNQFDPYLISPFRNLPSRQSFNRFTNINYHVASKKEQHILISHEQHIRPWFYAGLDFGALSSPGDFSRQLNTNRNFRIWMAYESPSSIYRNYISFTSNRVLNQENGGISIDSAFENASSLDTRTLPINLRNASATHKTRDYYFKQELNLSRMIGKSDSLPKKQDFNQGSLILSHALWYQRKSALFNSENPDSGYFTLFYIDSISTKDSTFYGDLFNEFFLEYTSANKNNSFQFNLGTGINLQEADYFTTGLDTFVRNTNGLLRAGLQYMNLAVLFQGSKSLTGIYDDSFNMSILMSYKRRNNSDLIFIRAAVSKEPHSIRDQFYFSNHFSWKNNFNPYEKYVFEGGIELSKYKISIRTQNIFAKNILFYREDFLPQTYGDWVSYGNVSAANIFNLGKFGLDEKIILGYTGNENVIKVPRIALYGTIYYKNNFFKKALGFRTGVDVSYYTSYYGYGYMPATGIFYLQDEKKIGNYPLLGVFLDLKIKTANLFFKLDHLNAGIGSRNYYGAYHYPLPGRSVKFGVKWDLID